MQYSVDMITNDADSKDILRCVKTLLSVRAGEQPANRDFGISWECLDNIPEVAETLFLIELEEKIEKYEPRAVVKSVDFFYDGEAGAAKVQILFAKGGEVE